MSFEALVPRLVGLKSLLVCDHEGAVLLRAGDAACEPKLQRLSAIFSQTAEHAGLEPRAC